VSGISIVVVGCLVCLFAAIVGALIGSDDEAGTLAGFLGWVFGVAIAAVSFPFCLIFTGNVFSSTIVAIALGAIVSFAVAINMAR
jgi:hypothetical protein